MSKELNWASFVSGGGTTMREMGLAAQRGEIPGVNLSLVVSSNPEAGAIQKARELGLEADQIVVVDPRNFRGVDGKVDQEGFGRQILIELKKRNIDFFTQNGWLPKTPPNVIWEFDGYNQHPQRVPEFGGKGMYGVRPHAARLYYASTEGELRPAAEPVAQRVSAEFDSGEVVVFQSVPIPNEILTEDIIFAAPALQKLVLPHEHAVQIELLRQIGSGTVHSERLPDLPVRRGVTVFQAAEVARNKAIAAFPQP